ncbi:MAG: ATP phosphoribosyltransferase regulatory subunit [Minisyncoccales bacterium]
MTSKNEQESKNKKEFTEPVKGFSDYTGKEAEKRAVIKEVIKGMFQLYGFQPAETPVIEKEEFVKSGTGNEEDEVISDIYRLKDKGDRNLALRYEFTFQLKRLMKNKKLPFKRFQIGPVFRDEPIKGNRFRQFTQCDADVVGSTLKDDAEVLCMAKNLFKKLKINSSIYYNNRKLLNEILDKEGIKTNKEQVIREIDKLDKQPKKQVKENLSKYNAERVLDIITSKKQGDVEKYSAFKEIKELQKYLNQFNVEAKFAPYLARGLSYYNGTVFEIKTPEMNETITAGGAFNFNDVQSVGISFGLDRLQQLTKMSLDLEKYLVVSLGQDREAIKIAEKLRNKGKNTSLFYGKPSKALAYANSYNINKVVFVGEEEIKNKKLKVKNLDTGKESSLKI